MTQVERNEKELNLRNFINLQVEKDGSGLDVDKMLSFYVKNWKELRRLCGEVWNENEQDIDVDEIERRLNSMGSAISDLQNDMSDIRQIIEK